MTAESKPSRTSDVGQKLTWLAPRLAIVALSLVSAYEVYRFLLWFLPEWLAMIGASAFELVYIALVVIPYGDDKQKGRGTNLSRVAVAVSVVYTFIAGYSHLDPEWMRWVATGRDWLAITFKLIITALHAVPLATMAYSVSGLVLHETAPTKGITPLDEKNAVAGLTERLEAIEDYLRNLPVPKQDNSLMEALMEQVAELGRRLEDTRPVMPLLPARSIGELVEMWQGEGWEKGQMIETLEQMGFGWAEINKTFGMSNRWAQTTLARWKSKVDAEV